MNKKKKRNDNLGERKKETKMKAIMDETNEPKRSEILKIENNKGRRGKPNRKNKRKE